MLAVEAGQYSRPAPPEWANLKNFAQSEMAFAGETQPGPDTVSTVSELVRRLDDEALDNNRYHGIGLVMCGLARALQQPEIRQHVITRCANGVANGWRVWGSYSRKGLLVSDISIDPMGWAFKRLAQEASDALPRGTQLLADILQVEAGNRMLLLEYPRLGGSTLDCTEQVVKGEPIARIVSINATAAAGRVLQTVLKQKHAHNSSHVLSAEDEDGSPSIAEVVGTGETNLRQLGLEAVVRRCAVLRRDEFILGLEDFIGTDSGGSIIFRRDRMVRSSELAPPEVFEIGTSRSAVLHGKRLKCPAVFVSGLIPMVLDIVTETVAEAQAKVDAEVAKRSRSYA